MYEEYGPYGSGATHPDASGYGTWRDSYPTIPVNDYSLGGQQTITPMDLTALDASWDPAVELEQLLQTTGGHDFVTVTSVPGRTEVQDDDALLAPDATAVQAPFAGLTPRGHRRRRPSRTSRFTLVQKTSFCIAALAAVIVSMVSVFGGMVAMDPLRHIAATRAPDGLVGWWPLLVYGPWMVASLSVLRAALHQRRAVHSWSVVLFFSGVATLLCVVQAPRTVTDAAAAGLPSLAALACFQQLVRQITLTRPPRQATARHRPSTVPAARRPSDGQTVKDAKDARTSAGASDGVFRQRGQPEGGGFPRR